MASSSAKQSVNAVKRKPDPYARDKDSRIRWKRARTDALSRARYRCEVIGCGVSGVKNLTTHHIIPLVQGGGDYPENLIALCPPHHDQAELFELRNRNLIRNLVTASRQTAQAAEKFMGDQRPWWKRLPIADIDEGPHKQSPYSVAFLRKAINRLKASGRTWLEIAHILGFKSAAQAYLIRTGGWKPKPDRLEEIMRDLPRELWQTSKELRSAILVHLRTERVGIRNAMKSRYLARQFCTTDRMIRAAVNELRKQGYPICSSVGQLSGFYWPASRKEYESFKHRDYLSRIKDMKRVVDAMDMGAERLFAGQPIEMELQPELI